MIALRCAFIGWAGRCIGAALHSFQCSIRSRRRPVSKFMTDSVSAPAGERRPVSGSGETRSARRLLGPRGRQHRRRLRRYRHQPALRLARSGHRGLRREHGELPAATVLGVVSLILWALFIIVTLKYVVILLRADNNGEGGTLTLMALASRAVGASAGPPDRRDARHRRRRAILRRRHDHAGNCRCCPRSKASRSRRRRSTHTSCRSTVVILVGLFAVQSRGTAKVAALFGPIMVIWFVAIAIPGIRWIAADPGMLWALNPYYGVAFLLAPRHGRPVHARRRVPRRHRRRSALCRPRPFRPQPDPGGVDRARAAVLGVELSRPGRAGARRSRGDGESVLPALSRMGADPDGGAGDGRRP